MGETTTVTHNEGEDPSVLAEAAVASAAIAGASAAVSQGAKDDAEEARRIAEQASSSANAAENAAMHAATSQLSEDDVRRIAKEEHERTLAEIIAKSAATPPAAAPTPDPQVQQPLPKSAAKAGGGEGTKRTRWADKWLGGA
jgi:hypothetical protein